MHIKKATLTDLTKVAVLFDKYRVWYKRDTNLEGATQFLKERISNNESVIFLVEDADGNALGFTQLYPIFSSTRMKRVWLLNDLFVHADARGKGLSKLLIEAAKNHCRKKGGFGVTLETQKTNDIGNKLYPSVGFVLNTEQNFYEWTA